MIQISTPVVAARAASFRLLLLIFCTAAMNASAEDFSWLEAEWRSTSASKLAIEDGLVSLFSCGSEIKVPYHVKPIADGQFEFSFEVAIPYYFKGQRTDSGMCLTHEPIWDYNNERWVHSKANCYSPYTKDEEG